MTRIVVGTAMLAALAVTMLGAPARAQVRDAVYRGTLVCDKLPFFETAAREAIEVGIAGGAAKYTMVVRLRDQSETAQEAGAGKVDGQAISLQGEWTGKSDSYKASYSGTFVRRSAKLTGTQTWTHDGKTFTRKCSGAIKRPLRAFLPRQRKTADQ
jgi:capsid protein